jgi:hypothetical protein
MSVFSAALSFCPDTPAFNATPFTINHHSIAVKSVILCKAAPTREAFEGAKGSWLHFSWLVLHSKRSLIGRQNLSIVYWKVKVGPTIVCLCMNVCTECCVFPVPMLQYNIRFFMCVTGVQVCVQHGARFPRVCNVWTNNITPVRSLHWQLYNPMDSQQENLALRRYISVETEEELKFITKILPKKSRLTLSGVFDFERTFTSYTEFAYSCDLTL